MIRPQPVGFAEGLAIATAGGGGERERHLDRHGGAGAGGEHHREPVASTTAPIAGSPSTSCTTSIASPHHRGRAELELHHRRGGERRRGAIT